MTETPEGYGTWLGQEAAAGWVWGSEEDDELPLSHRLSDLMEDLNRALEDAYSRGYADGRSEVTR